MINDLATESTNVHTRFPYAVVAFMVVVPAPCLVAPQREALIGTLERLSGRSSPLDSPISRRQFLWLFGARRQASSKALHPDKDQCSALKHSPLRSNSHTPVGTRAYHPTPNERVTSL
jgi:hypothetical protein